MFCSVIMLPLLYVHVCVQDRVARTSWKTRPRPKTVIFPIKINQSINQSLSLSLSVSSPPPLPNAPLLHPLGTCNLKDSESSTDKIPLFSISSASSRTSILMDLVRRFRLLIMSGGRQGIVREHVPHVTAAFSFVLRIMPYFKSYHIIILLEQPLSKIHWKYWGTSAHMTWLIP